MATSGTATGRAHASDDSVGQPARAAFWLVAGVLCLLFCAAGATTPLYGVYRAQLGFSTTTLTAIFAVYALVLLLTLLVFGSVSDYVGRRRVILAALAVTAAAYAVFLAAHSVGLGRPDGLPAHRVPAMATAAFRGLTPRTAMLAGCLVLLAGLAVTFAAIAATATAALLAGTALAGVGFGLAVLGANRVVIALAAPAQRARLIAAIFIVNFLGLSVPVVIAGVATAHFGLHRTLAYCVATAMLVAVAAGGVTLRGRPATSRTHQLSRRSSSLWLHTTQRTASPTRRTSRRSR
jgi:MFS family permease